MARLSNLLENNYTGFTGSRGTPSTGATNSEIPPANPSVGEIWFNTVDASVSIWYSDGTNAQWISTSGPSGPTGYTGSVGFVGSRGISGSVYAGVNSVATSRILTDGDASTMLLVSSASPVTVTIPLDATFNFPIGTVINMAQDGTGALTIGNEVGVTVRIKSGLTNVSSGQYSIITASKVAANYWYLSGDLQ